MTDALAVARRPVKARTFDAVCRLRRDNVGGDTWWAIINSDDEMVVAQQRSGEEPTGSVTIPRDEFAALCRWYLTGRWRKPRKKRRATPPPRAGREGEVTT